MKRPFWLLLFLAIWCTACAIWYMFAVKGIPSDPVYFHPQPPLIAIIEILVMLLIACLIGYGIGWSLRGNAVEVLEDILIEKEGQHAEFIRAGQISEGQLELAKAQLQQSIQSRAEVVEEMKRRIGEQELLLEGLREELQAAKKTPADNAQIEILENEANTLRYRNRQLEFQIKELEQSAEKLQQELEAAIESHSKRSVEPTHPFVRPVREEEKDDLTQINGIGPFIEKRLNMVGVYTLRQISEFTPELIEQVSKAIEFFPKRMVRDNWVGQAQDLLSKD